MKIKIIANTELSEVENEVNEFLLWKKLQGIKFQIHEYDWVSMYFILIIYQ